MWKESDKLLEPYVNPLNGHYRCFTGESPEHDVDPVIPGKPPPAEMMKHLNMCRKLSQLMTAGQFNSNNQKY